MIIERLEVEGGFLDGLVLDFKSNLNVLIGGRGVGKTGIVELIRYCLSAPTLDPEQTKASFNHASGVLGDGLAKLTVVIEGAGHAISRSIGDRRATPPVAAKAVPLIFSQREIETLGRTPRGRLNLLDSFLPSALVDSEVEKAAIKSLSVEIRDICGEIDEIQAQLEGKEAIESDLASLRRAQSALGQQSTEKDRRLAEMDAAQKEVNKLTLAQHSLERAKERLDRWIQALPVNPGSRVDLGEWPMAEDPLKQVRAALAEDAAAISALVLRGKGYLRVVDEEIFKVVARKQPLEDKLRQLRQNLEEEQAGAGRIAREIGRLEEALSRMKSLQQVETEKRSAADKAQTERMRLLTLISDRNQELFEKRSAIAAQLSKSLAPRLKVEVRHSVDVSEYEQAIIDALRGSNLRYNEIAPSLARGLSPIELCRIVYAKDYKGLAKIINISEDRAWRLVEALRAGRIENVLIAPVSDEVHFYLLDGVAYKHIDDLSIGQRCTVLLSIILENRGVALIIDQPEDHLDNEFVADTLIKAIKGREKYAQTIISTHNANIPVLGDASLVVQLDSNGQRGFVKCRGPLTSPPIVEAILGIMEGGVEAFAKRSKFYESAP